jgi:hypothetical protein
MILPKRMLKHVIKIYFVLVSVLRNTSVILAPTYDRNTYLFHAELRHVMGKFSLMGRIISKSELPLKDLQISAYDYEPLINPNDLLGQASTDEDGYFRIEFDESKFSGFLRYLKTPGVRLIIRDKEGNEVLETKTSQTTAEIDYHIRVLDDVPDKDAVDIYSGNARRLISMLSEVGSIIGMENTINLDILKNCSPPEDIREKLQNFVDGYVERRANFNHFLVILSSLVDTYLEEIHVEDIGYDGPQVPREPRRESYQEVITWPRKEKYKWA